MRRYSIYWLGYQALIDSSKPRVMQAALEKLCTAEDKTESKHGTFKGGWW